MRDGSILALNTTPRVCSVAKVLRVFGNDVLLCPSPESLDQEDLELGSGCIQLADSPVAIVVFDSSCQASRSFCEDLRLRSATFPILNIGPHSDDLSAYLISNWNGFLAPLLRRCQAPWAAIQDESLAQRSHVEARIKHDLPKRVVPPLPSDAEEFLELVRARISNRPRLQAQVNAFLNWHNEPTEGARALKALVWGIQE